MADEDSGRASEEDAHEPSAAGRQILVAAGADDRGVDRRMRKVAHGIAHGMNNVLATVMGIASVLDSELDAGTPMADDMRTILAASRRGLDLTRSLLSLATGEAAEAELVALNEVVEDVASFLRPSLPESLSVETRLEDEPTMVVGEVAQLKQAVMSLVLDTVDAANEVGAITLSTGRVILDASELAGEDCAEGEFVRFQVKRAASVADGEAGSLAPSVFDKSAYEAAGLGLPFVVQVVRSFGGRVRVDADGSATMDLPAIDPELASSLPPSGELLRTRDETVLVVDDEALVRRSSERLLRTLGYEVLSASRGSEALEIYEREAERVSLVLLDLVMPGLDGRAVLERLLRAHPDARVVICTGYGEAAVPDLLECGAIASLQKPYTLKQLSKLIARIESPG